ncbi:MAG: DNA adenine methylase [Pyrinomonadaceae bacterium]
MSSQETLFAQVHSQRGRHKNGLVQPFLKWAGGKRQLLTEIRKYIPRRYNIYFEPFVGAGAVLFDKQPSIAIINDVNAELINCYRVIKSDPEALIAAVAEHQITSDYFYRLRKVDRDPEFAHLSPVERAARIIFLNKTCYNGLFRVNRQGQFNAPFGNYKNPQIINASVIKAIHNYFAQAQIELTNYDFALALSGVERDDFVYLDPPYDPVSDTASFTGYNLERFDRAEQLRLKEVCDDLTEQGAKVLLSNSATDFIRALYGDARRYTIVEVEASRNINSVGTGRGKVNELLIYNNYNVS